VSYDAIVIGAGLNGLTAAATLAKAGRRVLVVERSDTAGGMARALEFAPGFRAAPFAHDPGWLPPAIARALGLAPTAPDYAAAPLTVALDRREFLTLSADRARATEAIRRVAPQDAAQWGAFTDRLGKLAGFLAQLYQRPPPAGDWRAPRELVSLAGLALAFRRLGRDDMAALMRTLPMPVQDMLDDTFTHEPLKAALAAGGMQSIRQGPRSAGTAFVLLHHLAGAPAGMVRRAGAWRVENIVAVLENVARRLSVTIRTGSPVQSIAVKDDAVRGVVLDGGEELAAPLVLSSADPARTLLGMIDPVWLDPDFIHAVRNIKYRGSTAIVLYALDRLPDVPGLADPQALAGMVSLTPTLNALERAYDAAKYGRISERPHVEITVPTLAASHRAAEGKHVLIARMQHAPYQLHQSQWDDGRRTALARSVTSTIEDVLPGFAGHVLHQRTLAPPDLEAEFALTEGAASHGELMLDQILFMRPLGGWARYAMPVDGLFLCGAGTHPGPGIIGGSGWLAARRALRGGRR
jgi:phytoene dehydrogenase-like protein